MGWFAFSDDASFASLSVASQDSIQHGLLCPSVDIARMWEEILRLLRLLLPLLLLLLLRMY